MILQTIVVIVGAIIVAILAYNHGHKTGLSDGYDDVARVIDQTRKHLNGHPDRGQITQVFDMVLSALSDSLRLPERESCQKMTVTIKHEALDNTGMTIAALEDFLAETNRAGVPSNAPVKVNMSWRSRLKSIEAQG